MNQRATSLDALRGYAILTMVLSATVVGGILPAWMYHAQTPPPTHAFNPELPGLTWVDLVFPFFLFSMGAAFPFSVGKRIERGERLWRLSWDALKRGLQLTFFAIFIQHFYPYMLSSPQDLRAWLWAIGCFIVLFPMFMRLPLNLPAWGHAAIKWGAYAVAVVMLLTVQRVGESNFSLYTSNIIILLLANMALFGTLVYVFTRHNPWMRVGVLVILAALILSAKVEGSWCAALAAFTPIGCMYRFDYLMYLFIVIPGSFAGELLLEWMQRANTSENYRPSARIAHGVWIGGLALIVINLICLYNRWCAACLILSVAVWAVMGLLLRKPEGATMALWRKLWILGGFLLLLGLGIEPFQEGIKKDPATFSYFFVTSGLGCMALMVFHVWCDHFRLYRSTSFLVMSGQNPMIAYVAGDLLVMPLLGMLGITPLLGVFQTNVWMGVLQGVLLTSLSLLVTIFFTKKKWFWRT